MRALTEASKRIWEPSFKLHQDHDAAPTVQLYQGAYDVEDVPLLPGAVPADAAPPQPVEVARARRGVAAPLSGRAD